jgi:hypothetical protein
MGVGVGTKRRCAQKPTLAVPFFGWVYWVGGMAAWCKEGVIIVKSWSGGIWSWTHQIDSVEC